MKTKTLNYKGYVGVIDLNFDDNLIYIDVHGLKDTIVAMGETLEEAKESFHNAVDDYIEFCEECGESPEKPYSGNFPIRTSSDLHRKASLAAIEDGMTLNKWVESAIQSKLECISPLDTDTGLMEFYSMALETALQKGAIDLGNKLEYVLANAESSFPSSANEDIVQTYRKGHNQ